MSSRQYVITTTMFGEQKGEMRVSTEHSIQTTWTPEWRSIPKDHRDPEVQKFFPGKFCYHPDAEITFIFRTRR